MKKIILILTFFLLSHTPAIASSFPADSPPKTVKTFLVIFDPIVDPAKNTRLHQAMGWADPITMANNMVRDLKEVSHGYANYQIVGSVTEDQFPIKKDGFRYTYETYKTTVQSRNGHQPDDIDYLRFINEYDLCGKSNRGEIDEVWTIAGPWFGTWEATMTGPGAFDVNGYPITGTTCKRKLVLQNYSYERPQFSLHVYGHRTEATLARLYGNWKQNRTNHNWDSFGLVKGQSPNYSYSGCGSIHFTPCSTSQQEYNYTPKNPDNSYRQEYSNCDDFYNYPNLDDPQTSKKLIDCRTWGCNEIGYDKWWYSHLPYFTGIGPDKHLNNWWKYLTDWDNAIAEENNCKPKMTTSGSITTPTTLSIGTTITVKCASSRQLDCLTISSPGIDSCQFIKYKQTEAVSIFSCTPKDIGGRFEVLCQTTTGTSQNCCLSQASAGTINIISSITPPISLPGDANSDGKVNINDFAIWKAEFLTQKETTSDFDKSGKVNITDFAIWKTEYLKTK